MSLRILKFSKLLKSSSQGSSFDITSWDDLKKHFDSEAQDLVYSKWKEYLEYGQAEVSRGKEEGREVSFNRRDDIKSFLEFFNKRKIEENDPMFKELESSLLGEIKAILLEASKRKTTSSKPEVQGATEKKTDGSSSSDSPDGAKLVWTKSDLGKYIGGNINFQKMHDGKNFRGGLKPKYTKLSLDFFKSLRDNFGIKRVITLNGSDEWGGANLPDLVTKAGMQHVHVPMGTVPTESEFEKIKALLKEGSNLIHCTHGADRTGSVVGKYYMDELGWTAEQAGADAKKHGGHKYKENIEFITNSKFKQGRKDRMKVYDGGTTEKRSSKLHQFLKLSSK